METTSTASYYERVRRFETVLITDALRQSRGNQARAARLLGLSPTTLSSQLQRLGIQARDFKESERGLSDTFQTFLLWKSDASR